MEKEKNKTGTIEQRFTLLSSAEREYIQMTEQKINEKFKRPEITKAQYDGRIRRRVAGALLDIKLLNEKYPEKKLEKIYTKENIKTILEILEKAITVFRS